MRVLIAALLLLVPFSGCLGGVGLVESDLFDYVQVERGDPTPVAFDTCGDLLATLNLRAEQRALVDLHQSYEGRYYYGGFRGGDVVMEEAMDDSDTSAGAPAAAPQDGNKAEYSASDADVTGTNTQEEDVDEADILKTDGTWTYVIDGQLLQILHSETVGNLTLHSTVELGGGYGTQLLLIDRGNDDPADDRLVAVTGGVQDPDDEKPDPEDTDDDDNGKMAEDIAYYPYYGGSYSRIQVFDLADRAEPDLLADHYVEGSNVGVRLVDGVVYAVIHQYQPHLGLQNYAGPDDELLKEEGLTWEEFYELSETRQKEILLKSVEKAIEHNDEILAGLTLADHLPGIYHSDSQGRPVARTFNQAYCDSVLTTMDDMGRSVSTILSLDADAADISFETTQILGGYPLVYGAKDALVLASSSQEHWWFWAQPDLDEATNLHWFDLDGLDVDHRASGRVDGTVQDQFGIDVHDDQLRIATTTGNWGRWWLDDPEPMQNHMFIFEEVAGALVPLGSVTGFAEDERIWSARFTDDRAYIVTFEQIDPLWIIDLTDPADPEILGEVEVPGVSTYIHPLPGENELLTIGLGPRNVGDEESGLDWSRIQVSLFNISDPANAYRADVFDVTLPEGGEEDGYSWGYSAALHEHKAFTYWDRLGMLSIPVTWQHYERECSTDGSKRTCVETQEFHTGLDLIDVDTDAMELTKYGSVDQDHMMTAEGEQEGWYWGAEVQRSYFLGFPDEYPDKPVSVYAYSTIGVSAHDLETLADQDHVRFEGREDPYYYEDEPQPLLEDVGILAVA